MGSVCIVVIINFMFATLFCADSILKNRLKGTKKVRTHAHGYIPCTEYAAVAKYSQIGLCWRSPMMLIIHAHMPATRARHIKNRAARR